MAGQIGIVRNFVLGADEDDIPTAWFDCYYDDGLSVPVVVSGTNILNFLRSAGVLADTGVVNGTACVLVDSGSGLAFDHIAMF